MEEIISLDPENSTLSFASHMILLKAYSNMESSTHQQDCAFLPASLCIMVQISHLGESGWCGRELITCAVCFCVNSSSFERAKKSEVSYSFQHMYDFPSELDFAQGHMVLCICIKHDCIKKLVDKLRPITRFLRFLSSRTGTMSW